MGERIHFWKQIVLVEVLQVVDLIEVLKVVVRDVLNLVEDSLVLNEAPPEHVVVVFVAVVGRRVKKDVLVLVVVLKRDGRVAQEVLGRDLRSDFVIS